MTTRSLDDYGGPLANYAAVKDPTTDEDARYRNRYVCDAAKMTHTACLGIVRFTAVNGAAPTDPTGFVHDAQHGNAIGVKPVVARTGEGVWTITYPASVDDELTAEPASLGGGDSFTINIRAAKAQATAVGGVLKHAVAEVTSANVVTVRGFLADGTIDDIAGAIVSVWVY